MLECRVLSEAEEFALAHAGGKDGRPTFVRMFGGARVLVAPLDWGLGHAARDVPIIQRLLELDARPILAADKGPLALLRDAFPALPSVKLPGVAVRYATRGSQAWALARQLPSLLRSVREEHSALQRLRQELMLDAVISDQRFGLHASGLPSVIITHQLAPRVPIAQGLLRRMNHRFIARFDRCWVPDMAEAPGLAGVLSHGHASAHVRYIGPLSRLRRSSRNDRAARYSIVAVVSGPEPQRTLFEQQLLEQLRTVEGEHLLVMGKPDSQQDVREGRVRCAGHLNAEELTDALLGARMIVSRSGYTTLMDLHELGLGALLVPTPGQPEQEYLAELHGGTGRFIVQKQDRLDLKRALEQGIRTMGTARTYGSALDAALRELSDLIAARRSPATAPAPTFAR